MGYQLERLRIFLSAPYSNLSEDDLKNLKSCPPGRLKDITQAVLENAYLKNSGHQSNSSITHTEFGYLIARTLIKLGSQTELDVKTLKASATDVIQNALEETSANAEEINKLIRQTHAILDDPKLGSIPQDIARKLNPINQRIEKDIHLEKLYEIKTQQKKAKSALKLSLEIINCQVIICSAACDTNKEHTKFVFNTLENQFLKEKMYDFTVSQSTDTSPITNSSERRLVLTFTEESRGYILDVINWAFDNIRHIIIHSEICLVNQAQPSLQQAQIINDAVLFPPRKPKTSRDSTINNSAPCTEEALKLG